MSSAKFWNKAARRYADMKISDPDAYARKLAEIRAILHPEMQMVEFGCGTGSTAIALAPHVSQVRAVDLSQAMLEIAAEKIAAAGVRNILLDCAEIETAEIAPQSADIVLTMSLLHLLADRKSAMARVYDMLKPGGFFVSSTACIGKWNLPIRVAIPVMRAFGKAPLLRYFSPATLLADINDAGFAVQTNWQPGRGKALNALFVIARKPA